MYYIHMHVGSQVYKTNQIASFRYLSLPVRGASKMFDTVSFGNNRDFIQLPVNDIIEKVEQSIKPENILGRGGEASVYSIKDTGYCVRIPHMLQDDYKKGLISDLTPLEQVNHGVVKLGEKTIIMKKLDGFSMFPRPETGVTRAMVHSMIDNMPVIAYRQVLKQIAEAHEKGAYFDSSGANVIVNPIKKSMTVIDFTDCEDCSSFRSLKSLFVTLGMSDGILTKTQQKDRANKILSAVIEDFLPGNKPFMRIADYSFPEFIYTVNKQDLISSAYSKVFLNSLNQLKELKYMSIRGVKGYEDQMRGQVKFIKSLIKQLLT